MSKLWTRTGLIALLVLTIVVVRPSTTTADEGELPSECSVPGIEYAEPNRWIAAWHFDGTYDGCMIYTGERPAPNQPPEIIGYVPIECRPHGNVELIYGDAIFNGSSYLSCSFTPIPNAGPNEYVEYHDFWTEAKLGFSANRPQNPIFHHESVSFGVERLSTNSSRMVWSTAHTNQASTTGYSPWFMPSPVNYLLVETTCNSPTPCDQPGNPLYLHTPTINGVTQAVQTVTKPIRFKAGTTIITIGHTPGTNNYFKGYIDMLLIDPKGLPGGDCLGSIDPTGTVTPTATPSPTATPGDGKGEGVPAGCCSGGTEPTGTPTATPTPLPNGCGDPLGDDPEEIDAIDPDQVPQ